MQPYALASASAARWRPAPPVATGHRLLAKLKSARAMAPGKLPTSAVLGFAVGFLPLCLSDCAALNSN